MLFLSALVFASFRWYRRVCSRWSVRGHCGVDNVWQDSGDDGSKVQMCFLVRSTFTLWSGRLQKTGLGECERKTNSSILQRVFPDNFSTLVPEAFECVDNHPPLPPAATPPPPGLSIMVELAFYPAVALIYFFGVMNASKEERVELDDRASINVFCLFVLAQPLCLVFGGYTGMATYLLTALVSYNFLPWKQAKRAAKGKESKKKEWEHSEKRGGRGEEERRRNELWWWFIVLTLSVSINVFFNVLLLIFVFCGVYMWSCVLSKSCMDGFWLLKYNQNMDQQQPHSFSHNPLIVFKRLCVFLCVWTDQKHLLLPLLPVRSKVLQWSNDSETMYLSTLLHDDR